jgi:S-adenosylmethionine:tRNA ribosyltransferase-isomerase
VSDAPRDAEHLWTVTDGSLASAAAVGRPMPTSLFDYALPPELIAQQPAEPRDSSRLLVVDRSSDSLTHAHFRDIGGWLRAGDVLVVNRSRVVPARLAARRRPGGGAAEILLLRRLAAGRWEALVRPGRKLNPGAWVDLGGGISGQIMGRTAAGGRVVQFHRDATVGLSGAADPVCPDRPSGPSGPSRDADAGPFAEADRANERADAADLVHAPGSLDAAVLALGSLPLPPYIQGYAGDPERYQTVYGDDPGSAAAPTAGLHFTPALLSSLQAAGVGLATVTLHVGLDTFRPVKVDDLRQHDIHREVCSVSAETARAIIAARAAGGRVVAVGTTTVRTLETAAQAGGGKLSAEGWAGESALFIVPGYQFQCIDAMVTNFHLPRSTLLALVSAFAGYERIRATYAEAIRERYRFFSFGDAMLLL